jgi:hypothetical protein
MGNPSPGLKLRFEGELVELQICACHGRKPLLIAVDAGDACKTGSTAKSGGVAAVGKTSPRSVRATAVRLWSTPCAISTSR